MYAYMRIWACIFSKDTKSMRDDLQKKIDQSIKLIRSTCEKRGIVEVAYSGGKDSDVVLQLVKESGIQYKAIYKNTTIDPPGTIKHAIEAGAEIVRPKKSFFELISKKGFPNNFQRFCCKVLKEYKILDTVILGIRACESTKRKERYKEPTQCRVWSKKVKSYQIFPILTWTDEDVKDFIEDRGIKCHPLYYDEKGRFCVDKRLGCMGCPLMTQKKRIAFFLENPKWLRCWIRAGLKYKSKGQVLNTYEQMAKDLFFDDYGDFCDANRPNLFGDKIDWEKDLENYFNIDLTI